MTIEQIVAALEALDVDFALVVRNRDAGLGDEHLFAALDRHGAPEHPAIGAHLLCRGLQRALDLCDYKPAWAANVSGLVNVLQQELYTWMRASGDA